MEIAFVTLYEQNNSGGRPEDPMDFMRNTCLGGGETKSSKELEKENEELRSRVAELEAKLAALEVSIYFFFKTFYRDYDSHYFKQNRKRKNKQ